MSLAPPWVIYSDKGHPIAILPAGRPGEVANVEGLTMKQAQALVSAANHAVDRMAEAKLALLTQAVRDSMERLNLTLVLQDALTLLEECEWTFEDRGGSEWNVCQECGAERKIGDTDKGHKEDCRWLSTVTRLRRLLDPG